MAADLSTCPRCGAAVPEGARFCPSCGLSLAEAPREERRVVTVLFGDLSGFTEMSERLDAEEVKGIVDRAFEGLAELVTLYGGRIDKIIGDEIMAVFGAPLAHEDDPERAVRCALEMQRSLAEFSRQLERDRGVKLGMRIGVNTGEVVAGVAGGADAYTVIGDAVNAASRIEHGADPGQILAGERTYLATGDAIEYRPHPPVIAKGKAEPLAVWEAVAERALPGERGHRLEAPLVGRDEELLLLESTARIVRRDRRAMVVTILGSAGMGKSRLAEEFARRLSAQGVRTLAGRSLPYGTASPSFAVEEMVRAALEIEPGAAPEAARAGAGERLAGLGLVAEAERLLALAGLREVVGAREPSGGLAGPAAGSAPAGRGSESLLAAAALFETLAAQEGLLALVFHELHWAEDSLLQFVADLVERGRGAPLLVVCLARPELLDRRPSWTGRPGSTGLVLEPLPRDRAARLLDGLVGARSIHPAVRESILERAGGNPFFIEELVRLLLDQGALAGAGMLVPGTVTVVPGTVQALVSARLDALPPESKRVAQTAAVIGEEFWAGALVRLEPDLGPEGVEAALAALTARELLEPLEAPAVPGERAFGFRQAIAREVAYNSVPKQVRARLHAAVGSWLEDVTCACGMEREFYDLVAHHYERSARLGADVGVEVPGAGEKAREYLERAGDQAIGLDAAAAAAEFYERALAFARDDADRLHLRLHLGEALVGCWRPVEAERHLTEALAEARRDFRRPAEGKALRLLGDLFRIRGDHEEGRKLLHEALEIAREVGDPREEAEGLRSHGLSDLFQGRLRSAPMWFRQSLARYRDLGDRRGEGWSLTNLGWTDMLLGRLDEALGSLDEGAKIFGEIGDAEGVGWCLGLRAWVLFFQGRLLEAMEIEEQIESIIAAKLRPTPRGMGGFGWAIGRVLRAIICVDRARLGDAEELARSALAVFEDSDAVWGLAMARYPLGLSQALQLRFAEARETLRLAREAADRSGDALVIGVVAFVSAWIEFEAGDLERAQVLREQAWDLTEQTGVQWIREVASRWLRAAILRAGGRFADAREVLEEALAYPHGGWFPASRARQLLAEVLCDEGRAAEAIPLVRSAIESSGDDLCGEGLARRTLARALHQAGDPEEAERVLHAELALLEGSDWEQERVQALALLAQVLDEQGRHDEAGLAIDEARAIVRRFPPGTDVSVLEQLLAG